MNIIFCDSSDKWDELMKLHNKNYEYPLDQPFVDGNVSKIDTTIAITLKLEGLTFQQTIGIIVHELTHVIQYLEESIFSSREDRFDIETQAYLLQAMTEWMILVIEELGIIKTNSKTE
jgi:hypothetical protein